MEIKYLGHSCFRLKSKDVIVIIDPVSPETGYKLAKVTADVVTVSHQHPDHNFTKIVTGTSTRPESFIIDAPGEYEVGGAFIDGIASFHDNQKGEKRGKNIIFSYELEGITLCHLGDLGSELDTNQIDEIDDVDILFVPVGGGVTINAETALKVVNQIEPKIIIPMHYKTTQSTLEIQGVDEFLKQMGVEGLSPVDKLNIIQDQLPVDRQVVLMTAKGDKTED